MFTLPYNRRWNSKHKKNTLSWKEYSNLETQNIRIMSNIKRQKMNSGSLTNIDWSDILLHLGLRTNLRWTTTRRMHKHM